MVEIKIVVGLYLLMELFFVIKGFINTWKGLPFLPTDRLYIAPVIAAAGIQALGGLISGALGFGQKAKAAKMARANIQPLLKDDPYIDEAYGITGSMAGQGLSDAAKQVYITANDRNLNASLDAVLKGGGNMNNVGDLLDRNNQLISQLTLADENARLRNTQLFLEKGVMAKANENRDQFVLNEYGPWKDRAAAIAQLSEQGMNNIWKGVNGVLGAAQNYLGSRTYGNNSTGNNPAGGANVAVAPSTELSRTPGNYYTPQPYYNTGFDSPAYALDPALVSSSNLLNRYFNRPI